MNTDRSSATFSISRVSILASLPERPRPRSAIHFLAVGGELDLANESDFVREISAHVAPGCRIQVDLSAVTFMDARGVAACLEAQRRARRIGGDLAFASPSGIVAKVLQVLALEDTLLAWRELP